MSIANLCASLQSEEDALRSVSGVAKSHKRPTFHRELGQMLAKHRTDRGWSVQEAVNYSRPKHQKALTWNRLTRLESGKTKHPDSEALRALADLYELDYSGLARSFVSANYGSDLLGQVGDQSSFFPPREGETDGPTQTRIQQERRLRDAAFAKEIRAAIHRLTDIATALVEDRAVGTRKARGRRRDRKVG